MLGAAPLLPLDVWVPILDGDDHACTLFERHYSARKSLRQRRERGTKLIAGPGFKLVLMTPCRRGLFVWRKFQSANDQCGINCAVFRNEGAGVASDLIRAADNIADRRWPSERHYTYVDPRHVRGTPAGNCFRRAGWRECGVTKARGLLILERLAA